MGYMRNKQNSERKTERKFTSRQSGSTILQEILNRHGVRVRISFTWLRNCPHAVFCEHGNEPSWSIEGISRPLITHQSDYQLIKKSTVHHGMPETACFGSGVRSIRGCIRKFPDWVITKYTLTSINTHWEATQRDMAAELTRLTHKIAIELHLVADSCTISSSRSRRPVRKLLDTPLYLNNLRTFVGKLSIPYKDTYSTLTQMYYEYPVCITKPASLHTAFQKLMVAHTIKKFPVFNESPRFVTAFTRAYWWTLSSTSCIQSTSSCPILLT